MAERTWTTAARRAALALVAVLPMSAAAACGPSDSAATLPHAAPAATNGGATGAVPVAIIDVPDSLDEGLRLNHANYCGTCHRSTLAGTAGIFGPTHDGLSETAGKRIRDPAYTGKATTPEAYVRESIREPGAYRVPGFEHTRFLMPAYTQLTDAEVDALVRMLLWRTSTDGG